MSLVNVVVILMVSGVVVVIGLIGSELRARLHISKPSTADNQEPISLAADPFAELDSELSNGNRVVARRPAGMRLSHLKNIMRTAFNQHPTKGYGWIETIFWLLIGASFVDYLIDANSFIGLVVWVLTIGFHEAGHLICNPFGEFIMFAGGSIWQVLIWVLFTGGMVLFYHRISGALICWSIVGFSLVNLARYIDDARARKLPLLFGLDSTHHDWWWLLSHANLLPYDHLLAFVAVICGASIMLSAILFGIISAWLFPRVTANQKRRFTGSLRQSISNHWSELVAIEYTER